jgi:hypothetical protein
MFRTVMQAQQVELAVQLVQLELLQPEPLGQVQELVLVQEPAQVQRQLQVQEHQRQLQERRHSTS